MSAEFQRLKYNSETCHFSTARAWACLLTHLMEVPQRLVPLKPQSHSQPDPNVCGLLSVYQKFFPRPLIYSNLFRISLMPSLVKYIIADGGGEGESIFTRKQWLPDQELSMIKFKKEERWFSKDSTVLIAKLYFHAAMTAEDLTKAKDSGRKRERSVLHSRRFLHHFHIHLILPNRPNIH